MDDGPCYKRILLKLSGESLKGDGAFGISESVITDIAAQVKAIHAMGVQTAIVVGGGNFFRGLGSNNMGIDRASADYMGMLATVMNGIALRDVLETFGLRARLLSALEIKSVAETFVRRKAMVYLNHNDIVIFSAGTGNPYFTTDTAAALRAIEINADVFLKATMVDGVYSDDPKKVNDSVKFDHITYHDVLTRNLRVLDHTAVTLCKENKLPIKIFNAVIPGNIVKAVTDKHLGTSIY